MWENKNNKLKYFHGIFFLHGIDTILEETADSNEFFLINQCKDILFDEGI